MRLPGPIPSLAITTATQHSPERGFAYRAAGLLVALLIAILPLAHVTGMRNAVVWLIGAAALYNYRQALWKDNPALVPWLVWLAFAAMSIGWSKLPDVSFRSLRTDLLAPFVLFLTAFMLARTRDGRLSLTGGAMAGTLIALATAFATTIVPGDTKAAVPSPGAWGWLAFKASGPVDSSTYIAFLAVPVFVVLLTSTRNLFRYAAGAWLLLFAALGLMSENRTLVISLFLSLPCLLLVYGLMRRKLQLRPMVVAICVGLVVSAASVEVISRLRLPEPQPYNRSAALEMLASDTRPAIWAVYFELAKKEPWFGVGFGRLVPSKTYDLDDDPQLRLVDSQASAHAHNVVLSLVLQVGLVGLAIWIWLHVALLRIAVQKARTQGDREKAWAAAAVALVLAMLVKNSTDDLIVFGNALLYWTLMGAILGRVWWGGGVDSLTLSSSQARGHEKG